MQKWPYLVFIASVILYYSSGAITWCYFNIQLIGLYLAGQPKRLKKLHPVWWNHQMSLSSFKKKNETFHGRSQSIFIGFIVKSHHICDISVTVY